jgi:hypothetical protein
MSDESSTEAGREPEAVRPDQPSEASHDDIMKRLLDYQRRQQGGATKEEAASSVWAVPASAPAPAEAAPAPVDVQQAPPDIQQAPPDIQRAPTDIEQAPPDIQQAPPEVQPAPSKIEPVWSEPHPAPSEVPPAESHPTTDVDARIERLQGALDRLGSQIGEMRQAFQDMAIAADERLTEIESEIARVRAETDQNS